MFSGTDSVAVDEPPPDAEEEIYPETSTKRGESKSIVVVVVVVMVALFPKPSDRQEANATHMLIIMLFCFVLFCFDFHLVSVAKETVHVVDAKPNHVQEDFNLPLNDGKWWQKCCNLCIHPI